MSSSRNPVSNLLTLPVAAFQYRQTALTPVAVHEPPVPDAPEPPSHEEELRAQEAVWMQRVAAERAAAASEATAATEARLRKEFQAQAEREAARVSAALAVFAAERKDYFARAEGEIVRLALSIAAKILHREAQVDPLLLTAVVQIALNQLREGSAATVRVHPAQAARWKTHFAAQALGITVTVEADAELQPGDCVLETELGSANFSLEKQLKEVEQGFFDLLAQKPQ